MLCLEYKVVSDKPPFSHQIRLWTVSRFLPILRIYATTMAAVLGLMDSPLVSWVCIKLTDLSWNDLVWKKNCWRVQCQEYFWEYIYKWQGQSLLWHSAKQKWRKRASTRCTQWTRFAWPAHGVRGMQWTKVGWIRKWRSCMDVHQVLYNSFQNCLMSPRQRKTQTDMHRQRRGRVQVFRKGTSS